MGRGVRLVTPLLSLFLEKMGKVLHELTVVLPVGLGCLHARHHRSEEGHAVGWRRRCGSADLSARGLLLVCGLLRGGGGLDAGLEWYERLLAPTAFDVCTQRALRGRIRTLLSFAGGLGA